MSSLVRRFKKVGILFTESSRQGLKALALLSLAFYRTVFTSHFGGACRFEPSCSSYAVQAFQTHSSCNAFILTFKRICKCRPGGPYGYDPVPLSTYRYFKRQGHKI